MLIAGISALVFKAILPGTWYILLAAVIAAGCGYLLDKGRDSGETKMRAEIFLVDMLGMQR